MQFEHKPQNHDSLSETVAGHVRERFREIRQLNTRHLSHSSRAYSSAYSSSGSLHQRSVELSDSVFQESDSGIESISSLLDRFAAWFSFLDWLGRPIPAVHLDNGGASRKRVPLDALGSIYGTTKARQPHLDIFGQLAGLSSRYGFELSEMDFDEAEDVIVEGIKQNIKARENLNSDHQVDLNSASGKQIISSKQPGTLVTLKTKTSGLEMLYSPAFFLRLNQRFGGDLSSPVKDTLGPGYYLFGAVMSNGKRHFEKTEHDIPRVSTITLTI